jgi:hypothetical protein
MLHGRAAAPSAAQALVAQRVAVAIEETTTLEEAGDPTL